jgi:hypothetical protein
MKRSPNAIPMRSASARSNQRPNPTCGTTMLGGTSAEVSGSSPSASASASARRSTRFE